MSPAAALLYMMDMRHTSLGSRIIGSEPALKMGSLERRVALVTGGTGGIGRAAAEALANAGAEVHITGRDSARGNAAAASAFDGGGRIVFHKMDLSTPDAVNKLASVIEGELEGRPLDVLVQNLAVMPDRFERVGSPVAYERALSTNLLVFHRVATTFLPKMAPDGRIISVVSAGMHLFPLSVQRLSALNDESENYNPVYAYSVTHRARVLLTKRWAEEHAQTRPGLHFASVHPGWVETPGLQNAQAMKGFYGLMHRALRTPMQGADTIAWLADPTNTQVASGSYCWDRKERPIDLLLSGTRASEGDVDELVAWLDNTNTCS